VAAGCSPLNAPEISGSPSNASTALNKKFCDFQPSVLNAKVIPTPVSPLSVALSTVASIPDVLEASSRTSPAVVMSLLTTYASAELSTTLVTTWPLTASTVPLP